MSKKIAVLKIMFPNESNYDWNFEGGYPINIREGFSWKEVSDDEFEEIRRFINEQDKHNEFRYVLLNEDNHDFQKDFNAWKDKVDKEKQKLRIKQEAIKKREETRKKNLEAKKIMKAQKVLKEAGIL